MYTQKKSIENTHIVRERDRRRFRELLAVVSVGLPVGLFLLLFAWQNLEVIRLGRQMTRLQKTRDELHETNKQLRLEVERLTAPRVVEPKALSLGFRPTDASQVVVVRHPATVSGGTLR